jgi:hypothetical protein
LADEHLPDLDIIVFGPSKSTDAPYCWDHEKSDTYAFIDRGGTRSAITVLDPRQFRCAAQYLSSSWQQVGQSLATSRSAMP